jgi:hypothetical protein
LSVSSSVYLNVNLILSSYLIVETILKKQNLSTLLLKSMKIVSEIGQIPTSDAKKKYPKNKSRIKYVHFICI